MYCFELFEMFSVLSSAWIYTLGARDFSSPVSGFCKVFMVTRILINTETNRRI